jgi:hypothetical protein
MYEWTVTIRGVVLRFFIVNIISRRRYLPLSPPYPHSLKIIISNYRIESVLLTFFFLLMFDVVFFVRFFFM